METIFFGTAFALYSVCMSFYLGYAITKRETLSNLARILLMAAVFCHAVSLCIRTYYARQIPQHGWYVPWSNWFESFSFFSLVVSIEYLIIHRRAHLPILGAFVTPLILCNLIMA